MLKAKDFESVDLVWPIIGANTNHLCGEKNAGLVTNKLVEYVIITMSVYRRKGSAGWSNDNYDKLSTSITESKRKEA